MFSFNASRRPLPRPFLVGKACVAIAALTGMHIMPFTKAVLAQAVIPGIVIENQATGSYVDPVDSTTYTLESNIVQVTVAEVAGITLTPAGIEEAPSDTNSPAHQNDGDFDPDDIVYFLFTATNVGNDPTQFFIPGVPSSLTNNGTQSGPIEIIELDPDGASGPIAATSFSSLPITIRSEGNNTGDATALGLPVGAIPAGGSLTLRVPVKIASDATGDVSLTLGNVNPNDNSAATQNQDYQNNDNLDFYTQDNSDTDGIDNEAAGVPINGDSTNHRKESSASSSLTIGGTPSDLHILSGFVFQDFDGSNTKNGSEPGIEDVTIRLYLDTNNDGELTSDDDSDGDNDIDADDAIAFTSTDSLGFYQFNQLDGNYLIEVDSNDSDIQIYTYRGTTANPNTPLNLPRNADINGADITTGLDFPYDIAAASLADYGDAPDTYGTDNIENNSTNSNDPIGASHIISSDLYLGMIPPDFEADAPTPLDGTGDGAEDDGVTFPSSIPQGNIISLPVTVTGNGALNAWIDWNGNGIFEASEQIASNVVDAGTDDIDSETGTITLRIAAPTDSTIGTTFARFRYSSQTGLSPTDVAIDGEVEDYSLTVSAPPTNPDFGDAPDSYGDASHTIVGSIFLGSGTPDGEIDTQSGVDANGDDEDGFDDEDGVTFSPSLNFPNTVHVVQAGITNTVEVEASTAGFLNAWIDYNQDGDFVDDPDEQIFTDIALTTGTNTVTFSPDSRLLHGLTHARFRFSTQSGLGFTGLATNGEVEDYVVNVAAPVSQVSACAVTGLLNGGFEVPDVDDNSIPHVRDFGTPPTASKQYHEFLVPGWNFSGDGMNPLDDIEIWQSQHSGGSQPNFDSQEGTQHAEINAEETGQLFQDVVTTPGTLLSWQFYHRARGNEDTGAPGNDTLELFIDAPGALNPDGPGQFTTGNRDWELYTGTYIVPAGQYVTRFAFDAVSTASGVDQAGNFVDDVKLTLPPCIPTNPAFQDFGDAPDTYATNLIDNNGEGAGANHTIVSGLHLGTAPTAETDAVTPLDGSGDSADDGINVSNLTESAGSYTLAATDVTVTNTSGGSATLHAWIDFDNNGTFDIDEYTSQTVQTGITNGNPDGALIWSGPGVNTISNSTYARFRLTTDPTIAASTPGNSASNGEVEDYPIVVANSTPNVLLVKRITRINNQTANGGLDLAVYDPDISSPYDDNVINPSANPADTDKWPNTVDETTSSFLLGVQDGGVTEPKDEIEYTIYFLSTGDQTAENVVFCDRVPDGQTFVPNPTFTGLSPNPAPSSTGLSGEDRGILVSYNGSNTTYTNIGGDDTARFYPPGSGLPPACNLLNNQSEHNGAVVVNLGDLPSATSPGTPANSYGFVRFRATID